MILLILQKVVFVSTLLDENDLINIESCIGNLRKPLLNDIRNIEEEKLIDEKNIIFDRELCFLDSEIKDFAKAITYYGSFMEERGYAKVGLQEDILEREKKGSTYIGKGLAIPHSRDVFVNKSKVCIVKFKDPIEWQGNKLSVIFILCLKLEDAKLIKKFFKKFYSILENDEVISKINNAQSVDDIIKFFI